MPEQERSAELAWQSLRDELSVITRSLFAFENQDNKQLSPEISQQFTDLRRRLGVVQQTVAQYQHNELFQTRYRIEQFSAEDLLAKLQAVEQAYGVVPAVEKSVVVAQKTVDHPAPLNSSSSGQPPEADTPPKENPHWDTMLEQLGQEVSRVAMAFSLGNLNYEQATQQLTVFNVLYLTLDAQLQDNDPDYDKKHKKLQRVKGRLDILKDTLRTSAPAGAPVPESATSVEAATSSTFEDWQRDKKNHPRLFSQEIAKNNEEVLQFLTQVKNRLYQKGSTPDEPEVLKPEFTTLTPELRTVLIDLTRWKNVLQGLQRRATNQLNQLRENKTDIEAYDKAELLMAEYLVGDEHLIGLLENINTIRFDLWILEVQTDIDGFSELLEELPPPDGTYEDPVILPGRPLTDHLREWQEDIQELEELLARVRTNTSPRALPLDEALTAKQEAYLRSVLQPAEAELERRKQKAVEFSRTNLEQLIPAVAALQNRLNQINADFHNLPDLDQAIAILDALEANAQTAVAAAKLNQPEYETVLNNLWIDLQSLRDRYERWQTKQKELSEIEEEVESGIIRNLRQELYITAQHNPIEHAYGHLLEHIEESVPPDEVELRHKLEIMVYHGEFKQLRKWVDLELSKLEWANAGVSAIIHFYNEVEKEFFARNNGILHELEDLGDTELAKYRAETEAVKVAVTDRVMSHISWMSTFEYILIPKTGGSPERRPPSVSSESLPLNGLRIERKVKYGITESEFGEITNAELGPRTAVMRSTVEAGRLDEVHYQETAYGHCMRRFDAVYEGQVPEAKTANGERITTRNLHTTFGDLIEFVWKEEETRTGGPRFTKDVVMQAFRLHTMITMNHALLAEDSPTLADNLFYLFNWLDYCIKYAKDGTNKFPPLVTYMLFTYPGVKVMEQLYGVAKMEKVRSKLRQEGLLTHNPDLADEVGFGTFEFLADGGALFNLRNEGQGSILKDGHLVPRVKTPNFVPPLGWFTQKGPDGKSLRYPQPAGSSHPGRYITLNDMQDNRTGERIYELMDLSTIGDQMVEYYNQLSKNGMGFLEGSLKATAEDFLKKMDSPDFVAGLKNDDKYVSTLLPIVGIMIHEGDERGKKVLGKNVMNKVITMLIAAKCLMETSAESDKPWGAGEVDIYLTKLVAKKAIRKDVARAIRIYVLEGSLNDIRMRASLHKFTEQLESAARHR